VQVKLGSEDFADGCFRVSDVLVGLGGISSVGPKWPADGEERRRLPSAVCGSGCEDDDSRLHGVPVLGSWLTGPGWR
jgi:hypothetical protein